MSEVGLGSVTFVGSGPGEFALLTLLGARTLRFADLVVVDADADLDEVRRIGVGHARIEHVSDDETAQLLNAARDGLKVVRLERADHFLDADVSQSLLEIDAAGVRINIIPGLDHWATMLNYGAIPVRGSAAFLDATSEVPAIEEWPTAKTLSIHARPHLLKELQKTALGKFEPTDKVCILERVGTTSQCSKVVTWGTIPDVESDDCYLVAGPGVDSKGDRREGWFESKPLFDWRILSPRTKDPLDDLGEELAQYGASFETIPTMSIEPPRTEQGMERAMRGLVDGRYFWCVFTSPHAVVAVWERLSEYGLDSRAMSGISIAAVGRGTKEALAKRGVTADFTPDGTNTVAGLAAEFPAFDELMDPINRVLVPSADVAIDPLVEGLTHLGWEVEGVTAYRTVRAAPPPAEIRDDIKTGMFDAVVFNSASSVRNMIGIAGKPHAASIIVAAGEATAAACEEHGLRVDVIASSPTFASIADGLARFADRRREQQLAQGDPVKKPSERKRRRRRKTVAKES
ncbi:MAG: uroporphyrinogen-III synthase [Propionibacteriaceae bacterium]|nr:uroporphyrinogen-III synthase [Propionibacteriaceae bacterium]